MAFVLLGIIVACALNAPAS